MLVLCWALLFPSFTRAGDSYNDEVRLLDLEVQMLSLQQSLRSLQRAAIEAESREATRERAQNTVCLGETGSPAFARVDVNVR